jgi:hypothetical protein
MSAGRYSFLIEQGATTDFEIQYKDSTGTPVNFSSYEAAMQIRNTQNGTTLYATLTSSLGDIYAKDASGSFLSLSGSNLSTPVSSGSIGVYIGHAVTNDFSFNEAHYDIELTSGSIRTRLLQGEIKLNNQVTLINPQ